MLGATPLLRLYARWRKLRLDAQQPAARQERELLSLVGKAAATRFGRDHEFAGIGSVADFQNRVPLRHFEDFWRDYWKADFPRLEDCTWPGNIPYFAVTSGTTTGVTKHIPCSRDMLKAIRRAGGDLLVHHLLNRPASRLLDGRFFMLGGSTDLHEEAPGIYSGDLSGIAANEFPRWARRYMFPPRNAALIADWEEKIDRIAPLSLQQDIRGIGGTSSWLLMFFDKLSELRPATNQRLVDYYPRLELVVHGGVAFKPYAKRFAALLEGGRAELREVYIASEGFMGIADRGQGEGLRLIVDDGLFYEFVPTEELETAAPTRHWLKTVETGVDYAVILSTCAGAWAYVLGDTVRFVDLDPPRILVTGRTSYVLSAFGEHLIAAEIEEAVAVAANTIDAAVVEYCAAPIFPERPGEKGGHHYVVEFDDETPGAKRLSAFRDALDRHLCALNADYGEHRASDYGLRAPEVEAVAPGTFAAWMKSRGQLGGQHKVPRVVTNAELFANLKAFLEHAPGKGP
jgi:hypothetical protein